MAENEKYTGAWAVEAEGARIGIVTCTRCGAALVLDMEIDVMALHDDWHERLETKNDRPSRTNEGGSNG